MIRDGNGVERVVIIAWNEELQLESKFYCGNLKKAIRQIMNEDTGYDQTPGAFDRAEVYNLDNNYAPAELLYTWTAR